MHLYYHNHLVDSTDIPLWIMLDGIQLRVRAEH